jgi:hypothetical protein
LIHWIDLYYSSNDQIWVTFWSPFGQVVGDNWSWLSIGNEINLNHSWKKNQLFTTKFKQPTLLVLSNNKWNVHSKFIFSFEVGGLCVEHLTNITRGIKLNKKQKLEIFLLWSKHPFQCYTMPGIYKSCENNLKVLNLL